MRAKLERLRRRLPNLRPVQLESSSFEWSLEEEDVIRSLTGQHHTGLLFGQFSNHTVLEELEQVGILERLRQKGYHDFEAYNGPAPGMPPLNCFEDRFCLYGLGGGARHLLVELKTHWGTLLFPPDGSRIRALIWDWLSHQHPLGTFSPERPPLPGQEYPGLGIFRPSLELLLTWVKKMDLDAIVNIPEYFHNGVLYSSHFHFITPQLEGRLQALERDLLPRGLVNASWALSQDRVLDQDGQVFRWTPAEQVFAIHGKVADYFRTPAYRQQTKESRDALQYRYAEPSP